MRLIDTALTRTLILRLRYIWSPFHLKMWRFFVYIKISLYIYMCVCVCVSLRWLFSPFHLFVSL
jgi:hypothetical protein